MQTYSDYKNDTGLGFGGVYSPYDDAPNIRRVSDVGGSELWFRCSDETAKVIDSEIDSDAQCGPEDDGPEGSDAGLVAFWHHVEHVIYEYCAESEVWETKDAMLAAMAKEGKRE